MLTSSSASTSSGTNSLFTFTPSTPSAAAAASGARVTAAFAFVVLAFFSTCTATSPASPSSPPLSPSTPPVSATATSAFLSFFFGAGVAVRVPAVASLRFGVRGWGVVGVLLLVWRVVERAPYLSRCELVVFFLAFGLDVGWTGELGRSQNLLVFQLVLSNSHQLPGRSGRGQARDCGEFGVVDLFCNPRG